MNRTPVERILDDWDGVANRAQPPAVAPRRAWSGGSLGGFSLLPLAAAALAVAVGVAWLGGRIGNDQGTSNPSTSAGSVVTASPSDPAPSATATGAPEASATPSAGTTCAADRLRAQVTAWEGAAGTRIAHVTLTLEGDSACTIARLWRPELVEADGTIRIEGAVPTESETIEIRPGQPLTTLVGASNDCLPPPTSAVSVAFIVNEGARLVAAPLSTGDMTTPPCLGAGEPASISMQPWAR
jgi:hypothetical protein